MTWLLVSLKFGDVTRRPSAVAAAMVSNHTPWSTAPTAKRPGGSSDASAAPRAPYAPSTSPRRSGGVP